MSGLRRVAFTVPTGEAEIARAWLVDHAPSGFEERSGDGATEFAVYTEAAAEEEIRAVFRDVRSEPVAAGWEDRWKEFHQPVRAGGLWIGPPWIEPPADEPGVVVDPGRAFGTGAHPTTRACIELLARAERGSLLDAGCGSGVVAVAAVRLGFAPVHAVDMDEVAVDVAALTARVNGVDLDVAHADVLRDSLPSTDVVVANIELAVVEELIGRVAAAAVVASGYLASEAPAAPDRERVDRVEIEGWAADLLVAR